MAALTAAALALASPASARHDAKRWYWTERYAAAQIFLTDAEDRYGRQPAAILRGGTITGKVDCTGFPPLLRRNGLRMYRLLHCVFTIDEYDPITGDTTTSYWDGRIVPAGREDYFARWSRYA